MKKESIFTKEGVFGCDVFNLWFWKLRRSTLLRKVFSAAVEIRRRFLRRSFDLSAAGKSRWIVVVAFKKEVNFSQRLGKTGLQWQRETFLMSFSSRCVEVVHRRLWSGILNPPDDFPQLSFLKTLLSGTETASRTLLLPWERPEDCYCDQNFNHRSRENAGTEVTFFFFRLGCCSGAFLYSRVGWVSYPDGVE